MKITKDLEKKFNDQITLEFEASMTYRQLAIEADRQDLSGMGQWLRAQADEEIVHANKFIDHVVDREGHAQIESIPAPELTERTMTALEIFQAALAHEQKVSEAIRELYRETEKAGDLDARPLLNWFIDEQLEEEATVGEIVGQLELVGTDGSGLLRIDQELGQRTSDGTENEA
ncbi:ferritin [Helcobacillus massiliensis]|uniref:Ferritin n=1 Tax=Helcobacillus massiliensis TaxID=521392 RepID=A0A839QNK7_9MICO|nr:ferritin [Helcobacillus massiliensis]MBB3022063.1 ferritin [Helcobacillus massiliensis]MDK7742910.1 ferritin [Helcobacillus massiliensis]WOO93553.1 ferritin [Helcobacillus massiliensis]